MTQPSDGLDAYDKMHANQFLTCWQFRRTRKQARELRNLIRTQQTGHESWDEKRRKYEAYKKSPKWAKQREKTLRAADWMCARCGSGGVLHMHHLSYERLGRELPGDTVALCGACHVKMHPGNRGLQRLVEKHGQGRNPQGPKPWEGSTEAA